MKSLHAPALSLTIVALTGCAHFDYNAMYQAQCASPTGWGACDMLAMQTKGAESARYTLRAAEILDRECVQENKPLSCMGAASRHFTAGSLDGEVQKAVEELRKYCDGGDPGCCRVLALAYWDGRGVDEDRARAKALEVKGCANEKIEKRFPNLYCFPLAFRDGGPKVDKKRLEIARGLVQQNEMARARPILANLVLPPTKDSIREEAQTLLDQSGEGAGRQVLAKAAQVRAEGRLGEALALVLPLDGLDWPESIRRDAGRERDSMADELWRAEVEPGATARHYVTALRAAKKLAGQMPANHPVAVRTRELAAQAAAHHRAEAARAEGAGLKAATHFHQQLQRWSEGVSLHSGYLLKPRLLYPTIPPFKDCLWLAKRLEAPIRPDRDETVPFAGNLACELKESHRRWEVPIAWTVRHLVHTPVWVDELVTVEEGYSCKQPYTNNLGLTSYRDGGCTKKVEKMQRVQRQSSSYEDEKLTGTQAHDERSLVVRVQGTLRPDLPGFPEMAISSERVLKEEEIESPRKEENKRFSLKTLDALAGEVEGEVQSKLEAALAPIPVERTRKALQAFEQASAAGDAAATEQAALAALMRNAESAAIDQWLVGRFGVGAETTREILNGVLASLPATKPAKP
ncbi:MAG TPA: hypothetical protein VGK67_05360 [Myxococcales bacterium]|jgi:hypothetical protein